MCSKYIWFIDTSLNNNFAKADILSHRLTANGFLSTSEDDEWLIMNLCSDTGPLIASDRGHED